MRFIHIADVHLGAVPDKDKSWSKERADEIESTFDRLLTVAEERKVELLLIAGDLFHAPPSLQELKSLDYKLSKLTNTRTVMIAGNHDYIGKGSPAESYEFTSNTVLMPADTFSNAYLDDINVCVTGFSFGQVEYTEDVYADIMPQMEDAINILLAHGGDEKHIPINFRRMAEAGFDYCALGHIHKPEILLENRMAYAGSPEPLDMTETGPHGYFVGEIDTASGHVTSLQFKEVCQAQYIPLVVNVTPQTTNTELSQIIADEIRKRGAGNIYRFRIRGMRDPDISFDLDLLSGQWNIIEILDESEPQYDFHALFAEHPSDMIGFYIQALMKEDMSPVEKKALYYGIHALLMTKDERSQP